MVVQWSAERRPRFGSFKSGALLFRGELLENSNDGMLLSAAYFFKIARTAGFSAESGTGFGIIYENPCGRQLADHWPTIGRPNAGPG